MLGANRERAAVDERTGELVMQASRAQRRFVFGIIGLTLILTIASALKLLSFSDQSSRCAV
jgi:hypothetical protein